MEYASWYDDYAVIADLEPGEMMHWPLHSPHRVDNHDCLNVSLTTEYWTEPIRRTVMMNSANAVLRSKLGITPKSSAISGPGFWAKAALQAGVKRAGLLNKQRKAARPITFRLDPARPGALIDIAAPGGNTREDQNGDGMPDGVLQNTIKIGDPTQDDYFAYMGTSMASPHVAGVAALVVGEGVTDPNMVEKILKESARKPNAHEFSKERYGAGIIDAILHKFFDPIGPWEAVRRDPARGHLRGGVE